MTGDKGTGVIFFTVGATVAILRPVAYSIAPYASVQKSVNTLGGSGESIMRCVKRMPIIPY